MYTYDITFIRTNNNTLMQYCLRETDTRSNIFKSESALHNVKLFVLIMSFLPPAINSVAFPLLVSLPILIFFLFLNIKSYKGLFYCCLVDIHTFSVWYTHGPTFNGVKNPTGLLQHTDHTTDLPILKSRKLVDERQETQKGSQSQYSSLFDGFGGCCQWTVFLQAKTNMKNGSGWWWWQWQSGTELQSWSWSWPW